MCIDQWAVPLELRIQWMSLSWVLDSDPLVLSQLLRRLPFESVQHLSTLSRDVKKVLYCVLQSVFRKVEANLVGFAALCSMTQTCSGSNMEEPLTSDTCNAWFIGISPDSEWRSVLKESKG